MSGMLHGIRIVDLTTVIMGPFASRILADLGADVIKVEPPGGDSILNRNKRGVVLDLKEPAGQDALAALVARADVVLHNLRPRAMARLGFGYDRCRALKPDIIHCTACGFGSGGPYVDKPAYDDMIQAASGFAALSAEITGAPAYAPSVICDKVAGQAVANAILAALVHRLRTGEGQAIEVPMFEAAVDFTLVEHFGGAVFSPPRGPTGYPRIRSPERRPFATADGYACILPHSDRNWQDFFVFTDRRDLLDDARFRTIATRQDHLGELCAEVRKEAASRTTAEWVAFCERADIPCMPVLALDDLFVDPHAEAVDLFPVHRRPSPPCRRSWSIAACRASQSASRSA